MSVVVRHLGREELEAGLAAIRQAPRNEGVLELIVRRPQVGEREVIDEGHLDLVQGLVGDNWGTRGSSRTADGSSHPEMQLTVMNSRVIALLAQDKSQWPLAGDQLFVDMDLSVEHLPPGTRLAMGDVGYRGHQPAAYRLRQVRRQVRARGGQVRQLAARPRASAPRAQRPGGDGRSDSRRRPRQGHPPAPPHSTP